MQNKPESNNSIFKRLKLIKECPLCSHNYEVNKVVVLEEYKNNHLVHVTCSECNSAILHMIIKTQLGMNAIGIITDLSATEVATLKKRSTINEDELLEFHKYIQQKDNHFEQTLLNKQ